MCLQRHVITEKQTHTHTHTQAEAYRYLRKNTHVNTHKYGHYAHSDLPMNGRILTKYLREHKQIWALLKSASQHSMAHRHGFFKSRIWFVGRVVREEIVLLHLNPEMKSGSGECSYSVWPWSEESPVRIFLNVKLKAETVGFHRHLRIFQTLLFFPAGFCLAACSLFSSNACLLVVVNSHMLSRKNLKLSISSVVFERVCGWASEGVGGRKVKVNAGKAED